MWLYCYTTITNSQTLMRSGTHVTSSSAEMRTRERRKSVCAVCLWRRRLECLWQTGFWAVATPKEHLSFLVHRYAFICLCVWLAVCACVLNPSITPLFKAFQAALDQSQSQGIIQHKHWVQRHRSIPSRRAEFNFSDTSLQTWSSDSGGEEDVPPVELIFYWHQCCWQKNNLFLDSRNVKCWKLMLY